MENPEIEAKIEWNMFLNQVYDMSKQPTFTQMARSAQPDYTDIVMDKFYQLISKDPKKYIENPEKQLKEMMKTLNKPPDVKCEDGKHLVVKGIIIKTSDLANSLKCKGNQPQLIEIFASDTLIFDQDIDLRGFYGLLSIFAPTWSIRGSRRVNLDGMPSSEITPRQAPSGTTAGGRGTDGRPGNVGNTAGSFLGFASKFENGENLRITANGSDGSRGQNGGNGANGRNGHVADVEHNMYKCYKKHGITHVCEGEDGQNGGDGGDGGHGGYGGYAGDVKIISLQNGVPVTSTATNGRQGVSGLGGRYGKGGKKGDSWQGNHVLGTWTFVKKAETSTTYASPGKTGVNGANSKYIQRPKQSLRISDTQTENIINDYKSFIVDSLQNEFLRDQQYKFLLKLLQAPQFQRFYSTTGIVAEFTSLEERFYSLHENVDFLPLYQELLNHITTIKSPNEENKKVLIYLYTTTLSKICALQEQSSKNFITDLKTFLDISIEDIKQLKQADAAVAIEEYNTVYKNEIDGKIDEGKNLIQQYITPKIEETTAKMDANIQRLSDEIFELQRTAEVDQIKLLQFRRELKNNMGWKIFGKVLGGIGKVVSLCGPWGATAGSIISKGGQAVEFLANRHEQKVEETYGDYADLRKQYSGIVNAESEEMQLQISELRSQLGDLNALIPVEANGIQDAVERIDTRLRTWKGNQDDLFTMYMDEIKNIETKISSQRSLNVKTITKQMKNMKQAVPVIHSFVDIYKTVKHDQNRIAVISDEIEENKETIQLFKDYKKRIRDTLSPMLNGIEGTLHNLENGLNNTSSVRLEMTKWNVQNTFRNVKQILQEYTEGFDVQTELASSIDTIMDAINTMINVYDKIQSYEYQKKFSDYTAMVNSAQYGDVRVNDSELKKALATLQLYLDSNIVLQKYRQSITQIKQFAFPLAESYFNQLNLPQALKIENNIQAYTQQAINQLKNFQTKVYDSSIYISKFDDIKHRSEFYDFSSAGPFVVWSNRAHRDSILKLLKGEEVILYANPNAHRKNGIKFNMIDLRLKSPKYQDHVDEILNDFEVVLTHTGNNYYNCNNKTYVVNSGSQKFHFDFKKVANKPVDSNLVFEKVERGNFLLSPFTIWKVQLINKTADGFDFLTTYGRDSDLQLVGVGEYFERDTELCDQNLNKYYQAQDIKQKKEDECVRILSSSVFDKNSTCFVKYNPMRHMRKVRSIDDQSYYTSSSSTFSSPINQFFKWFNEKIKLLDYESSTQTFWNPEQAFNQANSLLVLAPLLLHFTKLVPEETEESGTDAKLVRVEDSRREAWNNYLRHFQNLVVRYDLRLNWIVVNLEDRREEVDSIGEEANVDDVERLETSLVTLLVDFLDDVMFDDAFIGIRGNKGFNTDVRKLSTLAEAVPDFEELFRMNRCNYCN